MELNRKCRNCGDDLEHKRANARFCSDTCRSEFHNNNKSGDSRQKKNTNSTFISMEKERQEELKREMEEVKQEIKTYLDTIQRFESDQQEYTYRLKEEQKKQYPVTEEIEEELQEIQSEIKRFKKMYKRSYKRLMKLDEYRFK